MQQSTQNRVHCWNHDVAPDYLRTKPTPEMEADEAQLDSEKNSRTFDQVILTNLFLTFTQIVGGLSEMSSHMSSCGCAFVLAKHNRPDMVSLILSLNCILLLIYYLMNIFYQDC